MLTFVSQDMKPQKNILAVASTSRAMKYETTEEDADNGTSKSAIKTSWRIEEARKIFALMREEYEESKKLFLPKRYKELERIIEMFTAEPITQKLRYLSTAESDMRYSRALRISQSRSRSSANSDGLRPMSNTCSVDSSSNITHSCSTSSCDVNFQSNDSICSNFYRKRSSSSNMLRSPGSSARTNDLSWRKKKYSSHRNVSTSITDVKNSFLDTLGGKSKSSVQAPSAPWGKRRRTVGVFSEFTRSSFSKLSAASGTEPSTRNANSIENLLKSCSKAYDFVMEKINLEETRSSSEIPIAYHSGNFFESFFTSSRRDHREAPRTSVFRRNRCRSVINKDHIFDLHIPSPRVLPHRHTEESFRHISSTRAPTAQRLSLPAGYRSRYFCFESPVKHKNCNTVSANSKLCQSRKSVVRPDVKDENETRIGGSVYSEEQFLKKMVVDIPRRFDETPENSNSTIDNIVLTIAYDNLVSLRKEYNSLHGSNVWRRYRKMKSIIKSCMNVLKRC